MRFGHSIRVNLVVSILAFTYPAQAAIDARMMRYPDVSAQQIVFTYGNELWVAPIRGGRAYKLTSNGGIEKRAKFSPDGKTVAYSATHNDNTDVFTIGIEGGVPFRVTYHPGSDNILDWDAGGKKLLIASDRTSERTKYNKLFWIDAAGGLAVQLPLAYGESAALSTDGSKIVYTVLRDHQEESWKRYRGGRAPDLWYLNTASGESRKITDYQGPDSQPMWHGDTLYYLSENGEHKRSNIWALNPGSGARRQVTHFKSADVRHPSIGPNHVVFEHAGRLYVMSLDDEQFKEVKIDLVIDQHNLRPARQGVDSLIVDVALSADSTKAFFEARGEVFSMDTAHGATSNLTSTAGVAERYPRPSPDGQSLAYFSDRGGEYQLVVQNLTTGATRVLGDYQSGYRYQPHWSPDSKKLVYFDNEQVLGVMDVASGKLTGIDKGLWRGYHELRDARVSWSPDSRWIAFSRHLDNLNQAIFLYDTKNDRLHQVTSGNYNDYDPAFDPEGNYLFLLSQRRFSPVYGDLDFTWTYANSAVIVVVPLSASTLPPTHFAWKPPEKRDRVSIDLEGFEQRIAVLPLTAGRFTRMTAIDGKLVYLVPPMARQDEDAGSELRYYDIKEKSEHTVLTGVSEFKTGNGGDKILVKRNDQYGLVEIAPDQELTDPLATENLTMWVDRVAEYAQMLEETVRYVRDFFYDPTIHGLDWPAVAEHYRRLLPSVSTDQDMTVLLRELVAELSGGHVWASVAPRRKPVNQTVGLLGVDLDMQNEHYRIKKIFPSATYSGGPHSPLADASLGVKEGDYIFAVNGKPLVSSESPWKPLEGELHKVVRLTVGNTPNIASGRDILIKTIASEQKLRELDWVAANRAKVEQASDGALGYIYVPDTSLNGQNDLMRQYRAQFHKRGLVIDERFNAGGALGDRLVELLNRPPLNYFSYRNAIDYALPTIGHRGAKALLINGWSFSGGDGFPLLFKTAKVGPLIGTRTAGGLIGPNLPLPLISGGAVSVPPQRVYDIRGNWAEGNEGVRPDIRIENDPATLYLGRDAQLSRAIEEVMQQVADQTPVKVPEFPGITRQVQ